LGVLLNGLNFALRRPGFILKRAALGLAGYHLPRQLYIGLTYRCQCRCAHCNVSASRQAGPDELGASEIKELISEAKKFQIPKIIFFGGEPLLKAELPEFVSYASSLGLLPALFTNGILLADKILELKRAGLQRCKVSLDSSRPEVHDKFRGHPGCFDMAVEGIRKAVRSGVKCTIYTIVSKEDAAGGLSDLKALIALAKNWNAHNVVILFPMAAGDWTGKEREVLLTRAERDKVRALYDPPFVCMEFPREDTPCRAGRRLIYIDPRGNVSPCPSIPVNNEGLGGMGSIRRESFRSVLLGFKKNSLPGRACKGDCAMNKCGIIDKDIRKCPPKTESKGG
jgi:MoaA/NifB/PqqE/SkfB family radical SAM enzyme